MTPSAHQDTFARDHLPAASAWPALLLDGPDTRYGERLNAAATLLDAMVADGAGESIALRSDDGLYTYREVQARVDDLAHVLTGPMGLVPGNRVLLRGANHPALAICWLAVVKAGLVVYFYMHLNKDSRLFAVALLVPTVMVALATLFLLIVPSGY